MYLFEKGETMKRKRMMQVMATAMAVTMGLSTAGGVCPAYGAGKKSSETMSRTFDFNKGIEGWY